MRLSRGVRAGRGQRSEANQNERRAKLHRLFLRQGRLDHFSVLQMRRDGRADLGDKVLQLKTPINRMDLCFIEPPL
jgi:hypothetical protein